MPYQRSADSGGPDWVLIRPFLYQSLDHRGVLPTRLLSAVISLVILYLTVTHTHILTEMSNSTFPHLLCVHDFATFLQFRLVNAVPLQTSPLLHTRTAFSVMTSDTPTMCKDHTYLQDACSLSAVPAVWHLPLQTGDCPTHQQGGALRGYT